MEEAQQRRQEEVLVCRRPQFFNLIGEQPFTSTNYRLLKAYDSPLPLHQFLATRAKSVRAILAGGNSLLSTEILQLLPNLRLIVTTSAGLNQIDIPECRRRGIAIANPGNIFSDDVADLAVGLLIDVWRNISASDRYVGRGDWPLKGDFPLGVKLRGKQIGIVGLGNIGIEIAKRLEPFGCHISYNSRNQKPNLPYPFYEKVVDLAANCDALIICCGLTGQTHHMIDRKVLLALGKRGIIINIARGAIVDEKELVRSLVAGEVAGAGLDVFENEPDVPAELVKLENVVLSPHCAVFTPESLKDVSELVVGNLEAFLSGKPLLSEYLGE